MTTRILAYGGSIINTKDGYSKDAINQIKKIIKQNPTDKFIFIIGGGTLCRKIQTECLQHIECQSNKAKDWIGIVATRINAEYVREEISKTIKHVHKDLLLDPTQKLPNTTDKVFFSGGWKPGWSTDYIAIKFAKTLKQNKVYKITEVDEILNVRPENFNKKNINKYDKLTNISWDKLNQLVRGNWIPGLKTPIDPPAAKLGLELNKKNKSGFKLYFGKKEEIQHMFDNKFKGIIIK